MAKWLLPPAALTLILSACQSALAARLLEVAIEQDGVVVVHTYYQDNGRADAATVWRYLQDDPIMVDDEVTTLEGDHGNPLVQTLHGDVVVRFQHTHRVIAQVRVTNLTLQRADAQSQQWFLPAADVERTAALAGLGPRSKPSPDPMLVGMLLGPPLVAVLVLAGIAAIVWVLFRRSRLRPAHDSA